MLSLSHTLLLNGFVLLVTVGILLTAYINKLLLLIAVGIVVFSLRNIVSAIINHDSYLLVPKTLPGPTRGPASRNSPRFDLDKFEDKVKEAFFKNASKKRGYIQEENKYWNNSYSSKADKIDQLKDLRLTDLRRDRLARTDDDNSFKL